MEIKQYFSKMESFRDPRTPAPSARVTEAQPQEKRRQKKAKPSTVVQKSVSAVNDRWHQTSEYVEFSKLQDTIKGLKREGKDIPKDISDKYSLAQKEALRVKQSFREVGAAHPLPTVTPAAKQPERSPSPATGGRARRADRFPLSREETPENKAEPVFRTGLP